MAERKLTSCIGYCYRQAIKHGYSNTAEHLWHGLYSMTFASCSESSTLKRPVSLYSALGLDEGMGSEHFEAASISCEIETCRELLASKAVAIDQPFEDVPSSHRAVQTEEGVMPMSEFEAFLGRLQQNLERNLMDKLGVPIGNLPLGLDDPRGMQNDFPTQSPATPSSSHIEASEMGPTVTQHSGSSSSFAFPDSDREARRRRRALRQRELEMRAGLG